MSPQVGQAWTCAAGRQGPTCTESMDRAPAGLPQVLKDALTLLQPVIKIQARHKKDISFKDLIEMH